MRTEHDELSRDPHVSRDDELSRRVPTIPRHFRYWARIGLFLAAGKRAKSQGTHPPDEPSPRGRKLSGQNIREQDDKDFLEKRRLGKPDAEIAAKWRNWQLPTWGNTSDSDEVMFPAGLPPRLAADLIFHPR